MRSGRTGRQPRVSSTEVSGREVSVLNAVAEALANVADVNSAMQETLALVADLLGLRTGWVWLLDSDTSNFYNAAAQNLPPYLQEPVRMTGTQCTCMRLFREGKQAAKNIDVVECSRLYPAVQAGALNLTEGLRYHASIPLYFRSTPLGIMNVTSPGWRELTHEELQLLSTIAYQVGVALDRARLAEATGRLARLEERSRIAREIHDTLAQGLTGIALQIEGALHQLDAKPDLARQRLERALAMARESLEDARGSVLNLRTVPISKPLREALPELARTFTSETGIRVNLVISDEIALSVEEEAELFRIAQEALANVRRHATARHVELRLAAGPRNVHLSIQDDGRGFDIRAKQDGHHGIVGMKERAKLIGGRLRIQSGESGTKVTVVVPLPDQP